MIKRLLIPLIVAVGVAVTIAGCGGGGNGSTSSAGSTTASGPPSAQLVKKANAICARVSEEITKEAEANEQQYEEAGEARLNALAAALIPALEGQVDELRSLAAESGEEAQIEPYLEAMERGFEGEGTSLAQVVRQFKPADKAAAKLGLLACALS